MLGVAEIEPDDLDDRPVWNDSFVNWMMKSDYPNYFVQLWQARNLAESDFWVLADAVFRHCPSFEEFAVAKWNAVVAITDPATRANVDRLNVLAAAVNESYARHDYDSLKAAVVAIDAFCEEISAIWPGRSS